MDFINVLWVDDNEIGQMGNTAARSGIKLTHAKSWEEAKIYLNGFRFEDWSAIILDCECALTMGGDLSDDFLPEALAELKEISQGRLLPWYVLSAGAVKDFSSIIKYGLNKDRLLWDWDWEKKYYSKNAREHIILFERIKKMAMNLPNIRVKHRFENVFSILSDRKLFEDSKASDVLLPVLRSLLCPDAKDSSTLLYYYNQLRQVVECLFKSCNKIGLLPDVFIDSKRGVNLAWSSKYLSGKDIEIPQVGTYRYGEDDRVFPNIIENSIRNILEIGNTKSHITLLTDAEKANIETYLSELGSGQYVIYGMALSLCSVFVWYQQYVKTHFDENANRAKCVFIPLDIQQPPTIEPQNTIILEDKKDYEGIESVIEVDEDEIAHCGKCVLRSHKAKYQKGVKVRLFSIMLNNFEESKNKYPYSAKYEKL